MRSDFVIETMKIEDIYFENNAFGKIIQEWASAYNVPTHVQDKTIDMETIDGLVVFHENHDILKHHHDVMDLFNTHQIGISKVDVNGTLSVAVSNFELWLDRNRAKHLLVVGDEKLGKNPNLIRFLDNLKLGK